MPVRSSSFLHSTLLLVALLSVSCWASAQPAGADGDDFVYGVMKDDTLIELSQRYTGAASNWGTLQRLNRVADPALLPIGLPLRIPFSLIPEDPTQAQVRHLSGVAIVNDRPLQLGGTVAEGDVVATTSNGHITLQLSDGTTLTVPPSSSLSLDRLREFRGTGLVDSIFQMREGSLESHVAPRDTGVGRFEVRTPVSVTGVRGTRLRVHTQAQGAQSEVLEGMAGLASSTGTAVKLRPGEGAAVGVGGQMLGVRALLPAPELPVMTRGGEGWVLSFPPVPGAVEYLVRIASDEAGTQLHSSRRFSSPEITFRAPGSGTYHVVVRAIDADGVMGRDASQAFEGHALLRSTDGTPIATAGGVYVTLTEY